MFKISGTKAKKLIVLASPMRSATGTQQLATSSQLGATRIASSEISTA
jgi:hypothetical protein